jgi:gliding motility-associated protein GldM
MGSTGSPETPRQKMIMLMYLVLTAMLALNVDKKVLDAFALVNQGFMSTIKNFSIKNESVYTQFSKAALDNQVKAGELNRKVTRIKQHSDSIYNYIAKLKKMIVERADGPDGSVDDIKLKEDLNASAELMIAMNYGKRLKESIDLYRDSLLTIFNPRDSAQIASIKKSLDTTAPPGPEGIRPSWENSKFEGYPLIAVITLMSKMQSDIRNSESDAINYLYSQITAKDYKFNKLKAVVIPKSSYILQGETYEAKVFISAIDTTSVPEIIVSGIKLPIKPGENAGTYSVTTSKEKEGIVPWKGVINYKGPDGNISPYFFEDKYEVVKPSATISPLKMNVLYANLPNPVSVSAPGISSKDLSVEMTNGRIEKTADGFLAYPEKVGVNAIITVKVTSEDRTVKTIATTSFRVKRVPNPTAKVAGKSGDDISKIDLMAELGVFAEMGDDFDFDLKFNILSFDVSNPSVGGYESKASTTGARFSQQQKDIFKGLSRGSRVIIENIIAKGPDGFTRTLNKIVFKII